MLIPQHRELSEYSAFMSLEWRLNLGERSLEIRNTEVSSNSQHYSEHQTVYTLRFKKGHLSVYNHEDKMHVA